MSKMERRKNDYITIKLPKVLVDKADEYVDEHPEYTSRTDLIKDALRRYFDVH